MSEEKKKDIGYAFRIGAQTADGISIDVTGNFPIGAPDAAINLELDKWINIFSRQRAKTVLAEEERLLKDAQNTRTQLIEQLRQAEEKSGTKTAERQQLIGLRQNVERLETQIAQREQGIDSLKKLI